jgi:hypothetical protein
MTQHAQIAERKYCRPHARPLRLGFPRKVIPLGKGGAVGKLLARRIGYGGSGRLIVRVPQQPDNFTVTVRRRTVVILPVRERSHAGCVLGSASVFVM